MGGHVDPEVLGAVPGGGLVVESVEGVVHVVEVVEGVQVGAAPAALRPLRRREVRTVALEDAGGVQGGTVRGEGVEAVRLRCGVGGGEKALVEGLGGGPRDRGDLGVSQAGGVLRGEKTIQTMLHTGRIGIGLLPLSLLPIPVDRSPGILATRNPLEEVSPLDVLAVQYAIHTIKRMLIIRVFYSVNGTLMMYGTGNGARLEPHWGIYPLDTNPYSLLLLK